MVFDFWIFKLYLDYVNHLDNSSADLGFIIVFQIAKASEYVAILRGEERTRKENPTRSMPFYYWPSLVIGCLVFGIVMKPSDKILGEAASDHGEKIDTMLMDNHCHHRFCVCSHTDFIVLVCL